VKNEACILSIYSQKGQKYFLRFCVDFFLLFYHVKLIFVRLEKIKIKTQRFFKAKPVLKKNKGDAVFFICHIASFLIKRKITR